MTNPLFVSTTGFAWNHDLSEALLVTAAVVFLRSLASGRSYRVLAMLSVGVLLGLGVGVRLTIAPAVAAFAGFIFADRRLLRTRTGHLGHVPDVGPGAGAAPVSGPCSEIATRFLVRQFRVSDVEQRLPDGTGQNLFRLSTREGSLFVSQCLALTRQCVLGRSGVGHGLNAVHEEVANV